MTSAGPEAPRGTADSPLYHIDLRRLSDLKRSAATLLAVRRGPSCPSRLKPDKELTDPEALIEEIAEYCSSDEGFIKPELPLQEIIFRILLSRRNQPTPLRELHYELTERWATPVKPMNISEDGLRRILDADVYYGFAPVVSESQGSTPAEP